MTNCYNSRLNTENGIEITSVGQYLENIKEISERTDGFSLFFRGQQKEYWDINPSLYRTNKAAIEHLLLKMPLTKLPLEFDTISNAFDLMTKYQHYGLCTRLLDITTNPLVALYFACQKTTYEEYEKDNSLDYDDKENYEVLRPWGIVYYKIAYPRYSYSKEVQIVSFLAQQSLETENDIRDIIKILFENNIISNNDKEKWLKKENYSQFIEIIQNNYVVIPTSNNERLNRQSGAFLLPGMFSIIEDTQNEFQIYKSKTSLRKEFAKEFFYIDGENKELILKELDLCNINESTLFPELEHQLNYIKESNYGASSIPDFVKYDDSTETTDNELSKFLNKYHEESDEINSYFNKELKDFLYNDDRFEEIEECLYGNILKNLVVDWYKKDSIKSKIKIVISRILKSNDFGDESGIIASELLEKMLNIYFEAIKNKDSM